MQLSSLTQSLRSSITTSWAELKEAGLAQDIFGKPLQGNPDAAAGAGTGAATAASSFGGSSPRGLSGCVPGSFKKHVWRPLMKMWQQQPAAATTPWQQQQPQGAHVEHQPSSGGQPAGGVVASPLLAAHAQLRTSRQGGLRASCDQFSSTTASHPQDDAGSKAPAAAKKAAGAGETPQAAKHRTSNSSASSFQGIWQHAVAAAASAAPEPAAPPADAAVGPEVWQPLSQPARTVRTSAPDALGQHDQDARDHAGTDAAAAASSDSMCHRQQARGQVPQAAGAPVSCVAAEAEEQGNDHSAGLPSPPRCSSPVLLRKHHEAGAGGGEEEEEEEEDAAVAAAAVSPPPAAAAAATARGLAKSLRSHPIPAPKPSTPSKRGRVLATAAAAATGGGATAPVRTSGCGPLVPGGAGSSRSSAASPLPLQQHAKKARVSLQGEEAAAVLAAAAAVAAGVDAAAVQDSQDTSSSGGSSNVVAALRKRRASPLLSEQHRCMRKSVQAACTQAGVDSSGSNGNSTSSSHHGMPTWERDAGSAEGGAALGERSSSTAGRRWEPASPLPAHYAAAWCADEPLHGPADSKPDSSPREEQTACAASQQGQHSSSRSNDATDVEAAAQMLALVCVNTGEGTSAGGGCREQQQPAPAADSHQAEEASQGSSKSAAATGSTSSSRGSKKRTGLMGQLYSKVAAAAQAAAAAAGAEGVFGSSKRDEQQGQPEQQPPQDPLATGFSPMTAHLFNKHFGEPAPAAGGSAPQQPGAGAPPQKQPDEQTARPAPGGGAAAAARAAAAAAAVAGWVDGPRTLNDYELELD